MLIPFNIGFYKAHITQYAMANYPEGYWENAEKNARFLQLS